MCKILKCIFSYTKQISSNIYYSFYLFNVKSRQFFERNKHCILNQVFRKVEAFVSFTQSTTLGGLAN